MAPGDDSVARGSGDGYAGLVPTCLMDDTTAVLDALRRAPSLVVPLIREMPAAILKRRPASGRWSAHEHACHLAHVHSLFFDRLDQMLNAPAPVIQPYLRGEQDGTTCCWGWTWRRR